MKTCLPGVTGAAPASRLAQDIRRTSPVWQQQTRWRHENGYNDRGIREPRLQVNERTRFLRRSFVRTGPGSRFQRPQEEGSFCEDCLRFRKPPPGQKQNRDGGRKEGGAAGGRILAATPWPVWDYPTNGNPSHPLKKKTRPSAANTQPALAWWLKRRAEALFKNLEKNRILVFVVLLRTKISQSIFDETCLPCADIMC